MDDIFRSVVVEAAGISANHPLAAVLAGRSEVMQLTQASHDAALKPEQPGGPSHAERAALACRMARLTMKSSTFGVTFRRRTSTVIGLI